MDLAQLLIFAWGLALVSAIGGALTVRLVDGAVHLGSDALRRLRRT